ncbi:endonuclease/exonuclease/phosphatase family protein [Leptospira fainei serovar Hurstbridge str. BUT 6]|uniref:Endonuclease/exonuclease/phosphatase family protein n=1 Tax=Leptospira fainei serovar Hurstbridge str. BUT 6 TaxID=1193011 RepID=S3V0K7_9LEPT|nr:endonuclease/exonuclease/phosphatase family protein [Leptospira fainei]EPG76216.1 endonuclease/exonuclease/phosphatase family protein [Leptospira fainei serovar Hurstbridge str. BUT 6]
MKRAKKILKCDDRGQIFFQFLSITLSALTITCSVAADSSPFNLVISSFNAMFLYDEKGDTGKFPVNRQPRIPADFETIRALVLQNSPDIIGFQEIESESAIKMITNENYNCSATRTHGYSQEVGLCWKKALPNPMLSELPQLSLRPGLRKGLMAEFPFPQGKFTVISVHLKAGQSAEDQSERQEQIKVLGEILARKRRFVLLGDFNENLKSRRSSWNILKGELRLTTANYKAKSNCWQHKKGFIDYLITDQEWKPESFRQFKFKTDDGQYDGNPPEELRLSDHCPISGELIWRNDRSRRNSYIRN